MKKFYFLILFLFFLFCGSFGQTYTVPIQGPGFDDGNTFAANGWTVVNSSANKWVVGTKTFFSAPNSAYISIDGDPSHYSYDNTTAHVSHFYQKISIPANAINISLSFELLGNNQFAADGITLLDGLEVFIDTSLTPPVADVLPAGKAKQAYLQFNQNSIYTQEVTTLDGYSPAGKSFLLIFSWINNGDGIGNGPPASVDVASLSYCLKSSKFNVTGGGAFCTGSSGVGVGLSGSTIGISYQLYRNNSPAGAPIIGTGSALDFGPQTAVGNYTIAGSTTCTVGTFTYSMQGSATVTENSLPVPTIGSNAPICYGATLNLTSSGGTSYLWTGPNGFTSAVQNPVKTNFSSTDTGVYTVTVIANGCSAPATTRVKVTGGVAIGGVLNTLSVCKGDNGVLTLSGNSNNPQYWESATDTISGSWTHISNTGTTYNLTNITTVAFYRAVVSDGCSSVNSSIATVGIHGLWTGVAGTDWNVAGNWSDNKVASNSCPTVEIPIVASKNYPVLNSGPMATIFSLQIDANTSLTVKGNTLQIAGNISNSGTLDVTAGTIDFNGNTPQTIDGATFETHTIQNLIVSNTSGLTVSNKPGDTLNISGTLSFGNINGKLNTGNNITLLSTAAGTANVGIMSNTNTITGNVTVNRYINTGTVGNAHGKSWQMLATPTVGQTIRQSWMEGASASNVIAMGAVGPANPNPGYGTMTTSDVANAGNFPASGFDVYTKPGPSIKVYNYLINNYVGPVNTNIAIYNQHGYMILVRGDRSKYAYNQSANPTILRTKGVLFTPANPPPVSPVISGNFESVGNPFASAIDLRNIIRAGGVQDFYYVWDPKLAGEYGLGAFQTLAIGTGGNYYATPGGASYAGISNTIQSGQAFFVAAKGSNGTVTFNENCKVSGSTLVLKEEDTSAINGEPAQLRANLFGINNNAYLADGNLEQYNREYSDKIDGMDARKMVNSSENFGIISRGNILAIERRTDIQPKDTIFYTLSGLRIQPYRLVFTTSGLSSYGVQGFVEDTYLNTRTLLKQEGVTEINFVVTNAAGSYATNRFRIVFALQPMLQATIPLISLTASQEDADIAVNWNVKNGKEIVEYEVQTSRDGVNFAKEAIVPAIEDEPENYQWLDKQVTAGPHYYRIKYSNTNGKISYSNTVQVIVAYQNPSIKIYPNPVTDGIIHLQFINQPQGRYLIRLLNSLGQTIVTKQTEITGVNVIEKISWNYYLAHGIYQLEITKPDGNMKVIKVLY